MPAPAAILLVAALLPLASFAVLLFVGDRMGSPRLRMGTTLAGWVGTAAVGGSFVCSLVAMYQWLTAYGVAGTPWGWEKAAIVTSVRWLPVGGWPTTAGTPPAFHPGWLDLGLYVDSLTIVMFAMVTLVALLVHVFSIGYMRGDARFPRFFTYLSLFCFAMFGLLLGSTLLQIFVFWELVGLCSYLLIGFWFERPAAARAALKAFVVNRVGDAAFLVGFGLLFHHLGNASLPHLWAALGSAGQGGDTVRMLGGATMPAATLTVIGACLFLGAAGKSAQFPLHTWLPDAMAGPTPVSALIHAATMVAAGVYLVARLFPILTPDAKLLIAIAGCVTLLVGALVATVQTDIKRLLAYSTVSQLGYMMLAIGVGSWVGALFHLVTHAFFKALLFLAAGSVIHAAGHEQDMRRLGGLWKRTPVTAASMLVGVLAISGAGIGAWGLSGYYSKAHILTDAAAFSVLSTAGGRSAAYWLLFAVPAGVAGLTAFYMARCWMLTFWGRPRSGAARTPARAYERPLMYVPLMALAGMSVIAGWKLMLVRSLLTAAQREGNATVADLIGRADRRPEATRPAYAFNGWQTAWPKAPPTATPAVPVAGPRPTTTDSTPDGPADEPLKPAEQAHADGHRLESLVTYAWLPGLLLGVGLYANGLGLARRIAAVPPVRWLHAWLSNKMYIDELYDLLFVAPVLFLVRLAGWFDRHVIDAAVTAAAAVTERLSRGVGWHDRRVVDGAVAGVGRLAWGVGAAARAPQTGRVRLYVTGLMLVVVVGLAVTVGVMLWR